VVGEQGFTINERKTSFQSARAGRRIITGVGVGDDSIHPTRKMKRRLKAASHQRRMSAANGMREHCKLRFPAAWHEARREDERYWTEISHEAGINF